MPIDVEDKIKKLSLAQRKMVEARAAKLIAEEMTLRRARTWRSSRTAKLRY